MEEEGIISNYVGRLNRVRDVEKNRFFLLRRIFISIQGGQQGVIFRIYDGWMTMKREKKTSKKEDLFFSTSLNGGVT